MHCPEAPVPLWFPIVGRRHTVEFVSLSPLACEDHSRYSYMLRLSEHLIAASEAAITRDGASSIGADNHGLVVGPVHA